MPYHVNYCYGCQPEGGAWSSPESATNLQTTEIQVPLEEMAILLLKFNPSRISRKFPSWSWQLLQVVCGRKEWSFFMNINQSNMIFLLLM